MAIIATIRIVQHGPTGEGTGSTKSAVFTEHAKLGDVLTWADQWRPDAYLIRGAIEIARENS